MPLSLHASPYHSVAFKKKILFLSLPLHTYTLSILYVSAPALYEHQESVSALFPTDKTMIHDNLERAFSEM